VSRRRSSPRPRSPHCCRCCVGVALPLLLFLGPSLSRPLPLSRVHSLSLSLSFSYACPLSLSRFSRSLSRVFSPLVLALSFSHARLPLARVLSFSFSLSRSRRNAGSSHFTCRAMSCAAYPMPPRRPFHRPSLRCVRLLHGARRTSNRTRASPPRHFSAQFRFSASSPLAFSRVLTPAISRTFPRRVGLLHGAIFRPTHALSAQPLLSKFSTLLPPWRAKAKRRCVQRPCLPAAAALPVSKEMGLHRNHQSVVACNRRPRVGTALP